MSANMERFDPAAWHERGVLRTPRMRRLPKLKKRARKEVHAVSFALLSMAWAIPTGLTVDPHSAAASREMGTIVHAGIAEDWSGDRIDPTEWGQLLALFRSLPRDERRDPDEPGPFI